ncbi:MAG TPA: hypothetical protein VHO02_00055, partial [Fibrobacteria bacterium]|nr:hypothetical protein [Fibrobacteria bacterium]
MTIFHRTFRVLAAGFLLLVVAGAAAISGAAFLAEKYFSREHHFGEIRMQAYGPSVSPFFFSARADSLVLNGRDFRLGIRKPAARLSGWVRLDPAHALLSVRADSAGLVLFGKSSRKPGPIVFPAALRFPLGALLEWRVLTVRLPDGAVVSVDSARWRSRGSQALRGGFSVRSASLPPLRAQVVARWRGSVLRYRLAAEGEGGASLLVIGIREKRDLRSGHDSVAAALERTAPWLPPKLAARFSRADLHAKADWRKDSLKVAARFATTRVGPFDSAAWNVSARLGPKGGTLAVAAAGGAQSLRARGSWSHPGGMLAFPAWSRWRGEMTGEVRGAHWKLHVWDLPIDFEVSDARLDTGMRVAAHVETRDGSKVALRWDGHKPKRVELNGEVSATEPWALTWTDTNVSYRSARVEGAWEGDRLRATARFQEPSAYGASADSAEAVNEVTTSGYFLRSARIHRQGETFDGSGQVLWREASGKHAVSLAFTAGHPVHGQAGVAMRFFEHDPWSLELTAQNLHPSRFPYEPARRFAGFDPWLDGRFIWDPARRFADAAVSAKVTGKTGVADARFDGGWRGDSLHVSRAEVKAGSARLEASGTVPFDGHPAAMRDARVLLDGSWLLRADGINPRRVFAMAGRTGGFDGVFTGELSHATGTGLAGTLRLDSLRFPGRNVPEVTGAVLRGLGDSLSVDGILSTRFPVPHQDTLRGVLAGLEADSPQFHVEALSTTGFTARLTGLLEGWRILRGEATASGRLPLAEGAGNLEGFTLSGIVTAPLDHQFFDSLRFAGREMTFAHVSSRDTLRISGTPTYAAGALLVPDLAVRNSRGALNGSLTADPAEGSAKASLQGNGIDFTLPAGQRVQAAELSASLDWDQHGTHVVARALSGSIALPPTPYRVETGYDNLRVEIAIPPGDGEEAGKVSLRGRLHDMLLQRRWGLRDVTAFFTSFGRRAVRPQATRRSRPWEVDAEVEAAGSRNRIDTDVLRMTFTGDARISGVYPYTLIQGKITGLQGEVGPARQAYSLRDFELKWDNATLEDGTVNM